MMPVRAVLHSWRLLDDTNSLGQAVWIGRVSEAGAPARTLYLTLNLWWMPPEVVGAVLQQDGARQGVKIDPDRVPLTLRDVAQTAAEAARQRLCTPPSRR